MAGAQEQLQQMCFGPGERELNLSAVMARVQDLRRSLDTLVSDMAEGRGAHWAAFLDRLAVINVQHMQLVSQLRPLLRQYVSFPVFVDSPQIEADVPSLLASRLLPDQEAEEAEARAQLLGASQQPEHVLAAAEQQLEGLKAAVAALFNGEPGSLAGGILDPKGPQRKALDGMSFQIQKAIADQQAIRARSGAAALAAPGAAPARGAGGTAAAAAPAAGHKRPRPAGGGGGGAGGGAGDAAAAALAAEEEKLLRDLASGAAYRRHHTPAGAAAPQGGGAAAGGGAGR